MHKKLRIRFVLTSLAITLGLFMITAVDFDSNTDDREIETVFLNLNGNSKIDYTPATWKLTDNEVVEINIVNSIKYSNKISIIENILFDLKATEPEKYDLDEELVYYTSWKTALDKATENETLSNIPHEFEILESVSGGDITINLTNDVHEYGLSGTTKLLVDRSQNQILEAEIIIYQINQISDNEFAAIMKHEFGHALGLGHSNDKNDIMYYQIQSKNAHISDCTIGNIVFLYGGQESNKEYCTIK